MEPLPIEIQEPLKKEPVIEPLIIQDEELTGGYEAYITDVPVGKIDGIKLFVTKVNEHDKPGFLEMTAYSDITGSKKLNVMLANERMDKLENELRNNNLKEEVKVIRIDPHETDVYKRQAFPLDLDIFCPFSSCTCPNTITFLYGALLKINVDIARSE